MLADSTVDAFQGLLPEWLVVVVAAITMFGDPWLVVPVLAVTYWYGDRGRVVMLYPAVLGGMALVLVTKVVLGLPRPSVTPPVPVDAVPAVVQPLYEYAVQQDGYGAPSGHAAIATLLWGTVGLATTGYSRIRRAVVVVVVVVLVAASRVLLGVHYPIDVVAGVALGCTILATAVSLYRRGYPVLHYGFVPAIGIAIAAVVLYGLAVESLAVLGGLVGGAIGSDWSRYPEHDRPLSRSEGVIGMAGLGVVGLGSVGLVVGIAQVSATAGVVFPVVPLAVLFGTVVLGIAIFASPAVLGEAAEGSRFS